MNKRPATIFYGFTVYIIQKNNSPISRLFSRCKNLSAKVKKRNTHPGIHNQTPDAEPVQDPDYMDIIDSQPRDHARGNSLATLEMTQKSGYENIMEISDTNRMRNMEVGSSYDGLGERPREAPPVYDRINNQ